MGNIDFFYPVIQVCIGNYTFNAGVEMEICSDSTSYFDWAKIIFADKVKDAVTISKGDIATVCLGYSGKYQAVFEGYVTSNIGSDDMRAVLLRDKMLMLESTELAVTFAEATPQEILAYCLRRAGVNNFKLSGKNYGVKKNISIPKYNVIELIQKVHQIWGINEIFYFRHGVFYWGVQPEQQDVLEFIYGVNILSLTRVNGLWELISAAVPTLSHSQHVSISHPQITGLFMVKKVEFSTTQAGFIRTIITF